MFQLSTAICDELRNNAGLKVYTEDNGTQSEAWLVFGVKNGPSYRIHFISTADDNDVAVRVFDFLNVDDEHKEKLYPVINELNSKYRYVKFVCKNDGGINIEYDYPINSSPVDSAKEIVLRFANVINDSYPILMRAIWS